MSPVRRTNKRNPAVASDCEFKKRPDHNSGSRNCSSEVQVSRFPAGVL
jgi:hypothetical protein